MTKDVSEWGIEDDGSGGVIGFEISFRRCAGALPLRGGLGWSRSRQKFFYFFHHVFRVIHDFFIFASQNPDTEFLDYLISVKIVLLLL